MWDDLQERIEVAGEAAGLDLSDSAPGGCSPLMTTNNCPVATPTAKKRVVRPSIFLGAILECLCEHSVLLEPLRLGM